MKRYLMNKNVMHDGIMYANQTEIKESDKGFQELIDAGHATEIVFSEDEKLSVTPIDPVSEDALEQEFDEELAQELEAPDEDGEPAKPAQSKKKSKK